MLRSVLLVMLMTQEGFDGARHLVFFVGVERDPSVAPPARHEAVLALPLVRLQVRLGRGELAVGILALEGEVHGVDDLIGDQVADPMIQIKTYNNYDVSSKYPQICPKKP